MAARSKRPVNLGDTGFVCAWPLCRRARGFVSGRLGGNLVVLISPPTPAVSRRRSENQGVVLRGVPGTNDPRCFLSGRCQGPVDLPKKKGRTHGKGHRNGPGGPEDPTPELQPNYFI